MGVHLAFGPNGPKYWLRSEVEWAIQFEMGFPIYLIFNILRTWSRVRECGSTTPMENREVSEQSWQKVHRSPIITAQSQCQLVLYFV